LRPFFQTERYSLTQTDRPDAGKEKPGHARTSPGKFNHHNMQKILTISKGNAACGHALTRKYLPEFTANIKNDRATSRDKALWRALRGISVDALAVRLLMAASAFLAAIGSVVIGTVTRPFSILRCGSAIRLPRNAETENFRPR
jgi:hypothetical protein